MKRIVVWTVAIGLVATVAWAATKALGTVKCKTPGTVIELVLVSGQKLDVPSGKGIQVAEGTYDVKEASVYRQAKDGTAWKLSFEKGKLGDLRSVSVTKGQTTEIDVSTSLTMKPMMFMAKKDGKTGDIIVPISYTVTGKNGESYSEGSMMTGLQKAKLPYFQIADASSKKVLAEGQFEYG